MKGLARHLCTAAVSTVAVGGLACHSAHQPPRTTADAHVQAGLRTLLGVCKTARENPSPRLDPHEDLDSILWQQTAAEYRANTTTVYRAAAAALKNLAAAKQGENPVVVFDLDETVLDNSRFQGRLLAEHRKYDPDLWDCWVAQKQALLVPGAELLFRALVEQRVRASFITNRKCLPRDGEDCPQERETLANLNALLKDTGYVATAEEVLMSAEKDPSTGAPWDDEKKARRDFVAKTHAIVMLVGDDLGDFLAGVRKATMAARAAEIEKVDDRWGKSWFLLPNPSYGSWVTAVDQDAAPPRKRSDVVKAFAYPHE